MSVKDDLKAKIFLDLAGVECVRLATALSAIEQSQAESREALALLAPASADETLVGAIRNLQQAYITERDNAAELERENAELKAARAEAARIKLHNQAMFLREVAVLEQQLSQAREALQDAVYSVASSRKVSIGSIDNTYEAQISVKRVEQWRETLAILNGEPNDAVAGSVAQRGVSQEAGK